MSGEALAETQDSLPAGRRGHREAPQGAAHQRLREADGPESDGRRQEARTHLNMDSSSFYYYKSLCNRLRTSFVVMKLQ